ncbi:probable serine/threonine-protein kinase At1g54610, partial [Phalaenopsis equestris]|uniref:probable serine/threonine-protein kinase At1g54610 n=1 Tax=Phalaenopsis equestris TaxID=78828 RepID=UPI0009E41790
MGCFFAKPAVEGDLTPTSLKPKPSNKPRTADAALPERRRSPIPSPTTSTPAIDLTEWPSWLSAVAADSLIGWSPRSANSFEKIGKIGKGTYSNVFKAKDRQTNELVALKKVLSETTDSESIRFMAREIAILRRLESPNVVTLRGIITSRISSTTTPSLYLIFDYMEHDLAGLAASPSVHFSLPQIKCYVQQLLTGLDHCHRRGVLHRDLKGSNLLIDNKGNLKIADFGLASFFDTRGGEPMTSRVVTLWYRAPELILGATDYGVGIDLWSVGCILAELIAGTPLLPGRTEVEQLHKIFKLCGSPPEDYWKKYKFPNASSYRSRQQYQSGMRESLKDFPLPAIRLIEKLLSFDPPDRGTAADALNSEFFTTEPYACEPSSLPWYPPTKEMDTKLRDEKARKQIDAAAKQSSSSSSSSDVQKKYKTFHGRRRRAVPSPSANAELKTNLDRFRRGGHPNLTTNSEKFPPPHEDGAVGGLLDSSKNYSAASFTVADSSQLDSYSYNFSG